MADFQSEWKFNVDTSDAISAIRNLQRQISAFHEGIRNTGNAVNQAVSDNLSRNLLNSINATQKFSASLTTVDDAAQSFTNALEKNKLSMGQYFKFAAGSTKSFGKLFKSEFNTIETVARERVKTLQTQYIRMGRDANGALEAIKVRPLRLDMQNLGTQVAMTAQKQQMFNQLLKQGSTNLLNFGKNTQWAGRQLMVGFTIPLSIMGSMAIKEFQKIEEQAVKFRRVYGGMFDTGAETERALQNVRRLADEFTKYGIAVEKTIDLAAKVAQMGNVGEALEQQVIQATRLSVLGGMEQMEALDTTISLTNAFGIEIQDLANKINFLNAAENQTILAIEDFNTAIPLSGSVVRQLGGDVEDLAVLLTAMREGGINASQAGNALKSSLGRLIAPSRNAKETLGSFGIDVLGIVESNAGNLMGTINTLAYALDELDPLSRARSIEALFGKFQFARMSTLFQNITKEGSQANKVLKLTAASASELQVIANRELRAVEESPAFKLQKQIEQLQAALAPLGAEFIKIITPLIEFGTKILKSFNQMDDGAKAFVTNVITVLGLIAPVAIMTFGLIANGIANFIKAANFVRILFGKLAGAGTGLNQMTTYMTQEQLEATAAASSLGHAHSQLTATFTSEKTALDGLVRSYREAISAMSAYSGVSAMGRARPGSTPTQTKRYASGVLSVPGPKGKGDIVPAMLSPGEAVIPAKQADKYRGFIQQMISGGIPGFLKGGFIGMPKSSKSVIKDREAGKAIYQNVLNSSYRNVAPTEYGHQLAKTTGHSFPLFGVGGVYLAPSGKKVFVKPVIDEKAALAEMRGTQIARQAHDLKAPNQRIVVMRDPYDPKRKRRFLALESDLDPQFVNNDEKSVFNKEQYFRQLVASLVRVDKDLSPGNIFGDVVADVGPAGVFSRASGERDFATDLPSMEQQATINLLGVKGGAKRAFAESTVGLMGGMSPQQYHQNMVNEIQKVLPKLRQTVAGFGLSDPTQVDAYNGMIRRLEEGLGVDWSKFHAMHSAVKISKPKQTTKPIAAYADGIVSVPGPKGKGDVVPAMLSPGEAVIPAKKAKKYRGFIQQMISGNIPGFSIGEDEVGSRVDKLRTLKPAEGRRGRSAETSYAMMQGAGQDAQALFKKLAEAGVSGNNAMKLLSEAATKAKDGAESFSNFMDVLDQKIQQAEKTATGEVKSSENLLKDVRSGAGIVPVNQGGTVRAHLGSGVQLSREDFEKKVAAGELNIPSSELRAIGEADPSKNVNVKSGLYMSGISRSVNAKMAGARGAPSEELLETFDSAAPKMFNESIVNGGGSVDELSESAKALTTRMRELIVESKNAVFFDTSDQASKYNVKELAAGRSASAGSMEQVYAQAISDTKSKNGKLAETLKTAASTPFDVRVEGGTQSSISKKGGVLPELASQAEKELLVSDEDISKAKKQGKDIVGGLLNAIDQAAGMQSPSREMYDRGKNIIQGFLNGVRDGYQESSGQSSSPSSLPKPPSIPGFEDMANKPAYVDPDLAKGQSIGKNFFNKTEKFLENQIMGDGAFGKTSMGTNLREAFEANMGIGGISDLETVEGETQLDRSKREILAQQQALQSINGAQLNEERLLNVEDGRLNEEHAINLRNEDGSLKTRRQLIEEEEQLRKQQAMNAKQQQRADKKLISQDKAQKRQSRAGKALGVLGTATMVAGMASGIDGVVGETAQKMMPFLAGLSAATPFLLALPLPLAALALIVGGVAFGLYKWKEMIEKSRKEGEALGNALTMSTDKLIAFAESTGKVSATEERRAAQVDQLSGESEKTRKFGMTFLESEGGKGLLADIGTMASSGLGKQESAEASGRQLAMMMAQGLISSGEAYSIAAAIGTELNDYNFAATLVGSLVELTGPNGEDLTKDPLGVMIAIQESSESDMQKISDLALDEAMVANDVKDKIFDRRSQARTDRELRYVKGGWDGFVAGLEGWAADGFGFAINADLNPVGDLDPEFIIEKAKESERLQSASVQLGINQIQQNQQLLDSLTKQYSTQIKQKEDQIAQTKDVEKKLVLEKELQDLYIKRDSDLAALNARNAKSMDQIVAMRDSFDPKVFNKAIETSVLSRFEDDDPMKVFAESAMKNLNALQDSKFKTQIQLQFASGDLSTDAVQKLLNVVDKNPRVKYRFDAIVDLKGIAQGGQLLDLLIKAGLDETEISRQIDIFANIKSTEDFDNRMEALAQIANMSTEYGFRVNLQASSNAGTIQEVTDAVKALADQPDIMTKQQVIDAAVKDPKTYNGIIENWNTIVGASDVINKAVIIDFRATGDIDSINRYFASQGFDAFTRAQYFRSMELSEEFRRQVSNEAAAFAVSNPLIKNKGGSEGDGEDKGGKKEDPFENTLNSLKRLRNFTIDAKGGVEELLRVLGGDKKITVFRGMDQLSTIAKFGKEFSSYLSGLDEETRATFVEFKKGGPVLTETGRAMQKAFTDIGIGEFQLNIAQSIEALQNKRKTIEILTSRGLSYADALRVAADETMALSIASGTIDSIELARVVKLIKEIRSQDEVDNVLDKINQDIDDFITDISTKRKIKLNYTTLQQEAILNDETLRAMVRLGQTGADAFKERLDQITSSADFLQGVFDKGFGDAMDAFAVQEQKIQLQFDIDNAGTNKIIKEATEEIASLSYLLDDYEAGLTRLERQEEEVNKKYENRFKALDQIEKVNARIANQQKAQLGIAEALSRGDISAAAALSQQSRQEQAAAQAQSQKEALELSQERELARLRVQVNGISMTREDIEKRIKDLQIQIFDIEEDRLEPAQRAIDLAEIAKQKRIKDLDVLKKTREEWERIKNGIDLARISSDSFVASLRAALDAEPRLIEAYRSETVTPPATAPAAEAPAVAPAARTNSSFTVVAEAQQAGNTRAAVIDRGTAAQAAKAAVQGAGVTAGGVTIKAGSTLEFAEKVQAEVLANRAAWATASAAEKKELEKKNIAIMQASGLRFASGGMVPHYLRMGGLLPYKSEGGSIFKPLGTDTVPAMLTPGEFVVRKYAVDNFGVDKLSAINSGTYSGDSMYNYEVNINVKSEANPDQIAKAVMTQIKQVDSMRLRGNRF